MSEQALLWNTNMETLPKLFNDLNWCTRSHYEFLATDARFAILPYYYTHPNTQPLVSLLNLIKQTNIHTFCHTRTCDI